MTLVGKLNRRWWLITLGVWLGYGVIIYGLFTHDLFYLVAGGILLLDNKIDDLRKPLKREGGLK